MQRGHIFVNPAERRLRAPWRLLLQLALFVVVLLALSALSRAVGPGPAASLLVALLYLGAVGASVAALCRLVDRRPPADLGLHVGRAWWIDVGFGVAMGAFAASGIYFTERVAGWVTSGPAATSYALPVAVAVLVKLGTWIAAGVNEELVFRGYQLRNLAEGLAGPRVPPRPALALAIAIASALFGLAHLANGHATATSTISLVLAGVVLSLPVLLTGELAIPIGLHIAWNFFEATVYGFPVSGAQPATRLLTTRQAGPALWTGGDFGPEAGLLCVCWMALTGILIVAWCRWRHPGPDGGAAHGQRARSAAA